MKESLLVDVVVRQGEVEALPMESTSLVKHPNDRHEVPDQSQPDVVAPVSKIR